MREFFSRPEDILTFAQQYSKHSKSTKVGTACKIIANACGFDKYSDVLKHPEAFTKGQKIRANQHPVQEATFNPNELVIKHLSKAMKQTIYEWYTSIEALCYEQLLESPDGVLNVSMDIEFGLFFKYTPPSIEADVSKLMQNCTTDELDFYRLALIRYAANIRNFSNGHDINLWELDLKVALTNSLKTTLYDIFCSWLEALVTEVVAAEHNSNRRSDYHELLKRIFPHEELPEKTNLLAAHWESKEKLILTL